jgi:Cu-processing system ATP-binding protein
MTPLIEVRGLRKRYGRRAVLDGIDLMVQRGEVTAIIGPNGAGKTTLNKILLGLVHPDAGTVHFDGQPTADRVDHRRRIGYMPQAARFPEALTARDVLALLGELRGQAAGDGAALLDEFAVTPFLDQPVRSLSGGQRQRLNAVAAFLFAPELLLLDEPTAGLDPVASGLLKDRIRAARDAGCAVIVTSHILSELEEIADRIVFLLDGRVRWDGTLDALLAGTGAPSLERAIAGIMRGTPAPPVPGTTTAGVAA